MEEEKNYTATNIGGGFWEITMQPVCACNHINRFLLRKRNRFRFERGIQKLKESVIFRKLLNCPETHWPDYQCQHECNLRKNNPEIMVKVHAALEKEKASYLSYKKWRQRYKKF